MEEVGILILPDSVLAKSLIVSANEFNWREAFVRRLVLVGGINAFVCPMSRSDAIAVRLKIIVVEIS